MAKATTAPKTYSPITPIVAVPNPLPHHPVNLFATPSNAAQATQWGPLYRVASGPPKFLHVQVPLMLSVGNALWVIGQVPLIGLSSHPMEPLYEYTNVAPAE